MNFYLQMVLAIILTIKCVHEFTKILIVIKNKDIEKNKKIVKKPIKKKINKYPDYTKNINQFFLQKTIR